MAMTWSRIPKNLLVFSLFIGVAIVLGSCGDDDGPATPTGVHNPPPGSGDFVTMSINGGPASTYTEASGLPAIDCDPRVDWASYQVILWSDFIGGSGPNGYDVLLDIMFPAADTVGTYTVQGDFLQALFYNGGNYMASPAFPTSSGTVEVTRSDTRIEGTFNIMVIDTTAASVTLTGSFGVDGGWSLSCP
jgi:hypothetical protein